MKSILTIFTFVFTLMFSFTSFAEWVKIGGNTTTGFYVDYERLRKHDGCFYIWSLTNYAKPFTEAKLLSSKKYYQVDCDLFRYKVLQYVYHKEPMGRDVGEPAEPHNKNWRYPEPKRFYEYFIKRVCDRS